MEGEKDGFKVYSVPTKEMTRALGKYTVCFTKKDESFILFLTVPNLLIVMDVTTSAKCFCRVYALLYSKPLTPSLNTTNFKTKRNYPLIHRYPQTILQSTKGRIMKKPHNTPLQGHFCLAGWLILNFS